MSLLKEKWWKTTKRQKNKHEEKQNYKEKETIYKYQLFIDIIVYQSNLSCLFDLTINDVRLL